ncbi:MAG: discoidin domain-containing protein, partial [Chloroflexota bacterium]|nr:discoidin domain-containing protein [Chloroflexota bacterium]
SPGSGAVGTNITITAGGFNAGETINVSWNGVAWQSATADSAGSATVRATVPQLAAGAHTLQARGGTSGKSANTTFTVTTTAAVGSTSMVAPGTYVVTATREGLVGGTTSNGHVIVEDDHFASLPACLASNCPWLRPGVRDATWGLRTECGDKCYVLVVNPNNDRCQVAPVWDVGPWFRVDDWWNPTSSRHVNTLPTTKNILAQGYTGADAARNGLDVGYGVGPNGYGSSDKYLEVGNRSSIDLGDGTWTDLGLDFNRGIASGIRVTLLWQTGQDPQEAMTSCNNGVIPSATVTLSPTSGVVGTSVTVTGAGFTAGERVDLYWDATSGTPLASPSASSSGAITATVRIPAAKGGQHTLNAVGGTSGRRASGAFNVRPAMSRTPTEGPPGTAVRVTLSGFGASESVRLNWNTATGSLLGTVTTDSTGGGALSISIPRDTLGWHDYVGTGITSGLRAYGAIKVTSATTSVTYPSGTANPTFSGAKLAVRASTGTPGATSSTLVHDGVIGASWDLTSSPPPTSGFVTLDLGANRALSGVRWAFRVSGGADAMTIATSTDNRTWTTVGTFGNAPAKTWYGTNASRTARYVRFTFANPNGDGKIGYLAEAEIWGTTVVYPPGTANPSFSGEKLAIAASASSTQATSSTNAHDGNVGTTWSTTTSTPPPNAAITFDLGSTRTMSGVRWLYSQTGSADEVLIQTSLDGSTWRTVGRYGNAPANAW